MSRFVTTDTHTGVIVQESNWLPSIQPKRQYKPSKRVDSRSWAERELSTETGRLVAVALVSLLFGGALF